LAFSLHDLHDLMVSWKLKYDDMILSLFGDFGVLETVLNVHKNLKLFSRISRDFDTTVLWKLIQACLYRG
jgi:hypothetical protein